MEEGIYFDDFEGFKSVHVGKLRARLAEVEKKLEYRIEADERAHGLAQFWADKCKEIEKQLSEANRELAEVEAQRDGLKDVVSRGIELHENGDANTCMCGESMLHYPTDHSPVSMLEYYGDQWAAEAREALAKLEAHDGK